jgi:hypothetical protein
LLRTQRDGEHGDKQSSAAQSNEHIQTKFVAIRISWKRVDQTRINIIDVELRLDGVKHYKTKPLLSSSSSVFSIS